MRFQMWWSLGCLILFIATMANGIFGLGLNLPLGGFIIIVGWLIGCVMIAWTLFLVGLGRSKDKG